MSLAVSPSARNVAVERYGKRFDNFPPMFYMSHLDDDRFVSIIDQAIADGAQIDPEQFESDLAENTLL